MGIKPPTSVSGSLKTLRSDAIGLFLEENAILVLANHGDRFMPSDVEAQVSYIKSVSSRKELKAIVSQLRLAVADMRKRFGVQASQTQLLDFMTWLECNGKPGQACYLPRGMLSEYLSIYEGMGIPGHAGISVDRLGVGLDYPGGFEIRLLEASLFEDMCALFNCCCEANAQAIYDLPPGVLKRKIALKRYAALQRATMSAAFYFVEGYINCLATDFMQKHGNTVSENDRLLLTEWDRSKNRYKPVSTRDKLVKYPRIVTRSQFPPFDESNCSELAYFVSTAKEFRDAVVHASASFDPIEEYPRKEKMFASLDQPELEKIVDTSIALIRKIEILVYGGCRKWLQTRDPATGYFPDVVFE